MDRAFIFVDNLRIGGFQRLALDQSYALGDRGFRTILFVLGELPLANVPNFLDSERLLLASQNVELVSIGKSRVAQMTAIISIIKSRELPTLILSHSLRATFLLRVASSLRRRRLKVITTIHQLPTLSAPRQRLQRFIYAQFTWRLLAYSSAVKADWDARASSNLIFRTLIARKSIGVLRNGIYLKRLPININQSKESQAGRLIYLGRNTSWKGVATFLELASRPELLHFELLFMIPDKKDLDIQALPLEVRRRIQIVAGKPISSFTPRRGDVHLYPANYGPDAKFVESVSLNCLELACLGVPTVLTKNGLGTWPDLAKASIFYETDWGDYSAIAREILRVSHLKFSNLEIQKITKIIDIQNQISELLALTD
jgi:glycosyltransferase involved in cell wall biosynthesis